MVGRRHARPAPQHVLVDHELAVVLAHGPGGGPEARVGAVGAGGPLPHVAEERPVAGGARVQDGQIEEVPPRRRAGGHRLPLRLGGEPATRPPCIGVGLVVADVADGLTRVHELRTPQGEQPPVVHHGGPVQGGFPVLGPSRGPTVGQPQLGAVVAAVGHEGQPVAARHGLVGQGERLQPDGVAWEFVVEPEPVLGVSDVDEAAGVLDPRRGPGGARLVEGHRGVSGLHGVARQHVLDVHEQQLLVLLLVVEAELHEVRRLVAHGAGQELAHGVVHVGAVAAHLGDPRS